MDLLSASKLITCILPRGRAFDVVKMLKDEYGIATTHVRHARGSGRLMPLGLRGAGEQTEKEILSVVVTAEQAESIFRAIYQRAEINRPHGGLIFQSALAQATRYRLPPDLPQES